MITRSTVTHEMSTPTETSTRTIGATFRGRALRPSCLAWFINQKRRRDSDQHEDGRRQFASVRGRDQSRLGKVLKRTIDIVPGQSHCRAATSLHCAFDCQL